METLLNMPFFQPHVVTIQVLACIIDTNQILAGKMGSGVSITPAQPRAGLNINLCSGVTIR